MKRILVINVNWLGDVIFSTPALRALRKANPDAHITSLVIPRCEEILKNNPHINEIIVYDEYGKHRGLFAKLKFIRSLRKRKFDVSYVLHPSLRRAMIGFLAGIPQRIGYNTKKRSFLLSRSIAVPEVLVHKIDYFLNLLEQSGIKSDGRNCEFYLNDADKKNAAELLKANGINEEDEFVVLNPGGNWIMKRWAVDNFIKLADLITDNHKLKIVITGAKKDKTLAFDIAAGMKSKPIILTGLTSLHELAALMQRAACVVSADSGPMHIAVSAGANTIAIFGPTSSELTGPVGKGKTVILQKNLGCEIPCYAPDCSDNRCMQEVTPDEVYAQVLNMIREGQD